MKRNFRIFATILVSFTMTLSPLFSYGNADSRAEEVLRKAEEIDRLMRAQTPAQSEVVVGTDCANAANQHLKVCVCARDPRTIGCSNNLVKTGQMASASSASAASDDFSGLNSTFVPEGTQQQTDNSAVTPATSTGTEVGTNGNSNIFSDGKPITDSSYGSAKQGQGSNNSAGQIATMIGAGMVAAGTAMMPGCCSPTGGCCPAAVTMVAMGVLGLMQGAANKSTAGQHGMVSADVGLQPDGDSNNQPDSYQSPDPTTTAAFKTETAKGFSALDKVGAKLDPKTGKLTFPNGSTVGVGSLGDPSAMSHAGVSANDMKKIQKTMSDLEKAAMTKAGSSLASGESGYEGGGGGSTTVVSSDEGMGGMGGVGAGKDRDPATASVAGMTKNFNGELIGVAGDDIFKMMTRRYNQKSKEDSFLPPESSPAPFGSRN